MSGCTEFKNTSKKVLWTSDNKRWNIVKYRDNSTSREWMQVEDTQTGWTERPLIHFSGVVLCWDYPERIPLYVKNQTARIMLSKHTKRHAM